MENKNFKRTNKSIGIDWYKKLDKPYYIIGANIGPIYYEEYIAELKKDVFNNAQDVCLRDSKSHQYVENMKNVRVAPDIIFSYNVEK